MLRIKPTKAQAKALRRAAGALTATVEVRIATPGAPERVLKRTVVVRVAK